MAAGLVPAVVVSVRLGREKMPARPFTVAFALGCVLVAACSPRAAESPPVGAPSGEPGGLEEVVTGSDFHGVHGITVTSDGRVLAGSVVGQALYQVDPQSGDVRELVGPPAGMADDVEEGPDGTLAWTSFLTGKVHALRPGATEPAVLAEGLPAANSIAWTADGRLFVTQVFGADALWELDPTGAKPPRKVLENIGGLNGFDFGPDGWLYGPVWFKREVVKVNVDTGEMRTVASGFTVPAAANFDSKGNLYVVDTQLGQVLRIDTATGEKTVASTLPPSLDNLAFAADDRLFVTNMADNAVYEVDLSTGGHRTIVSGKLSVPAGISFWQDATGSARLYVADVFAYRTVDPSSGEVTDVRRMWGQSTEELDYPIWASADDDHVLLTSWTSATVQVVDRRTGKSLEMIHGFAAPTAAVELPDGRLLVAELGSASLVVVDAVDRAARLALNTDLRGPVGMVRVTPAGEAVYVTEAELGALARYDVANGLRTQIAAGLEGPEGLDVLPDGRVAVAEVGKRRLVAIDPASGEVAVLAEDLPIGLPAPEGTPPAFVPTGVAAAPDGSVYLSSDLENAIYRVRVSG
jgi:sugar lactone lactonase YvrE